MIRLFKERKSILAALFLGLMMLTLLLAGMPSREGKVVPAYLWPLAVTAFLLTLGVLIRKPSPVAVTGALLACWFVVCTLVNGDHYLEFNLRFVYGVVLTFGVGLPLFQVLEGKAREQWLTIVALCFALAALFMALVSTYACLKDCRVSIPGMEGEVGIISYRLYAFGKHPNEVGCLLNLGLLCWLMLAFRSRIMWQKVLCLFPLLPICFAMSLTVSRTAIAITSLALGGGCLVAITEKGTWKRWVIGVVVMAMVSGMALYVMMTGIPKLLPSGAPDANPVVIATVAPAEAAQPTATAAPMEETLATDTSTEDSQDADSAAPAVEPESAPIDTSRNHIWQRSFTDGMGTFSMRTEIWQSGIDYLKQNPRTLLLGNTDGQVARIPNRALDREIYHMHNTYLEVLLQAGIPGLVMFVFVLLSLLWYAAKQFFCTRTPAWRRVLAAAPVVMLICTLMEIYPSVSGHASDMMMFALIGAVIGYGRTKEKEIVLESQS